MAVNSNSDSFNVCDDFSIICSNVGYLAEFQFKCAYPDHRDRLHHFFKAVNKIINKQHQQSLLLESPNFGLKGHYQCSVFELRIPAIPHNKQWKNLFPKKRNCGRDCETDENNAMNYILTNHDHPELPSQANLEVIIKQFGYPLEIHHIVSKGYILTVHRIPRHSNQSTTTDAPAEKLPFVLVPGLMGDSAYYVIRNISGGYYFSDAGHDVWLVNNRGTRYSRNHTKLNPDVDKQFWNFSFHEMGAEDMPIITDYILSKSNATQLYLLGHSMGGAIISIFLSENPAYSQKVKTIFLLSPSLNVTHTKFPLAHANPTTVNMILKIFNEMEVPSASPNVTIFSIHQCKTLIGSKACNWMVTKLGCHGTDEFGESLYYQLSLCAAGASIKTMRHFIQLISRGRFAPYDYGAKVNLLKYGQENPPDYNLNSIKVPTYIFYSTGDTLVIARDLLEASRELGNVVKIIQVRRFNEPFFHTDYSYFSDAKQLVYDPILMETVKLESQPNLHVGLQYTTAASNNNESQPHLDYMALQVQIPHFNTTTTNNSGNESQPILQNITTTNNNESQPGLQYTTTNNKESQPNLQYAITSNNNESQPHLHHTTTTNNTGIESRPHLHHTTTTNNTGIESQPILRKTTTNKNESQIGLQYTTTTNHKESQPVLQNKTTTNHTGHESQPPIQYITTNGNESEAPLDYETINNNYNLPLSYMGIAVLLIAILLMAVITIACVVKTQ